MEKIAFVVVRYGENINGGAEQHCRMLAERLVKTYKVEVLTTCVENYKLGGNIYPEGKEYINGVLVRRFKANPIDVDKSAYYYRHSRRAIQIRKLLYKTHALSFLSFFFPIWSFKKNLEIGEYKSCPFFSTSLLSFLEEHKDDYKVFIPFTIDFYLPYYCAMYAPEKTIVIPTMHYNRGAFRSVLTTVFTKVAYVAFNTCAEEKLAKRIFGFRMSPHGIVSVGVDLAVPADLAVISSKYNLPDEYMLYVGRVDSDKLQNIFDYFISYKKTYPDSSLKFVVVGALFCEVFKHPDIIYTGFVDEHEKTSLIKHAKIVINPSQYESLSLILLEAMSLRKAVLVNGFCNVLKEHCYKSNNASLPYFGKPDFIHQLRLLDTSEKLRQEMGEKGYEYVRSHYSWEVILNRLIVCIERIPQNKVC